MLSKYNNNNIITLALYKIFTIINRSTFIIIVLAIINILFLLIIYYTTIIYIINITKLLINSEIQRLLWILTVNSCSIILQIWILKPLNKEECSQGSTSKEVSSTHFTKFTQLKEINKIVNLILFHYLKYNSVWNSRNYVLIRRVKV